MFCIIDELNVSPSRCGCGIPCVNKVAERREAMCTHHVLTDEYLSD